MRWRFARYRYCPPGWRALCTTLGLLGGGRADLAQAQARGRARPRPRAFYAGLQFCRAAGASLLYDAHELARRSGRHPLARRVDERSERAGIRSPAAVITVSDLVARELAVLYSVRMPTVVLNSPSLRTTSTQG
jgi:hypothetical protein